MSDTGAGEPTTNLDYSRQRLKFPRWARMEQELWVDLMSEYSQTLLGLLSTQTEDSHTGNTQAVLPNPDVAEDAVRLAARLADVSIEETHYRFWIQQPKIRYAKSKPARSAPNAPKPKPKHPRHPGHPRRPGRSSH